MIFIIIGGVYVGMKLDEWCNTNKIFTAILSVLAVVGAIYLSIKDLLGKNEK